MLTLGLWCALFAVPVVELVLHHRAMGADVSYANYDDALAFIESEWQTDDAIVDAPLWIDPLVRQAAGGRITLEMAGHSDLDRYARVWEVTIRGHQSDELEGRSVELERTFGAVTVRRFGAASSARPILFDLVEAFPEASVLQRNGELACSRIEAFGDTSGGLAMGPVLTAPRFGCGAVQVARTTLEDLELLPRRCVYQPPGFGEAIVTRYDDVPLGAAVVLHGGLWWEHERWRRGAPVDVRISLDGQEVGRMHHEDGDGWLRMEAAIPDARRGGRGRIEIAVSAPDTSERSFCWAADVRGPA